MKYIILLLFVVTLYSCNDADKNGAGQEHARAKDTTTDNTMEDIIISEPAKPEDPITTIKNTVVHINTTANLTKKHYEFTCDEKMMVDYFYEDGEIVKIAVDFGTVGDVYAKEGYYYKNGRLVFFYEFTEGGPACEGCIKTHEYRAYFNDGEVIRYLKDDEPATCTKCDFNASSRQYTLLNANNSNAVKEILCPGIN